MCASDLLGKPLSEKWSVEELKRLCDADKLVGHLTEDRPRREETEREWGGDEDSQLLKAPIHQLLREASSRLPKAARAFPWG